MERLKGMKTRNKWTLLIAVIAVCLVMGLTQMPQARAAEEDKNQSMDYLDPFELTVLTMDITPTSSSYSAYIPTKIWIPYRPVFRSPCVPTW